MFSLDARSERVGNRVIARDVARITHHRSTGGSASALISSDVTVHSSDATHRLPQGSHEAVEVVVGGVLPARAGVDPEQTTAKARPHFELRATANASLVGNVIG